MPRSPLTESIQKVRRLVLEIQETLTVDEFNLLLDELVPEPEPAPTKKPQKKSTKKASGKSQRASGMAAALNRSLSQQRELTKGSDDDERVSVCQYQHASGQRCTEAPDANVHHLQTAVGYHEFDAGKLSLPAHSAAGKSSSPASPPPAPARDDSYGVNSGIGQGDAQGVAGGSSGD